jgi:hypothetical protein
LSLIPAYHPEVREVEFPSGNMKRAPGVEYKCVIPSGPRRGWCVERVMEYEPLRRTTVAFTDDSWGISKLVENFVTEISLEPETGSETRVSLRGYYAGRGWRGAILNAVFLRRKMRKHAEETLEGLKRLVESRTASSGNPA